MVSNMITIDAAVSLGQTWCLGQNDERENPPEQTSDDVGPRSAKRMESATSTQKRPRNVWYRIVGRIDSSHGRRSHDTKEERGSER